MIDFHEFKISNGLQVVVHPDHTSPIVCLNTMYKVGSRNEDPERTGFAHLFEHLMFGGSLNIPVFDEPLQAVGGDNNAFTNADITNYYTMVPSANVETAFWLESDRMLGLSFDPNVLEVQRNVVIEEYKQRYLNQPYGDVWLKLSPEAYHVHPYRWPTIGKDISHIENATMENVRWFFQRYYHPGNAILVISGDITLEKASKLTEKWFGPIPSKEIVKQEIPQEPVQFEPRKLITKANVPQNSLYKVFHMDGRNSRGFHTCDLLSDLLGRGKSSMLFQELVKKYQLMTNVTSYVTGSVDPGLLVIHGKLVDGVTFEQVEKRLNEIIKKVQTKISKEDLSKVKNLAESSMVFGEVELLNRSMGLAYASFLGNTNLVNMEINTILSLTADEISHKSEEILNENNCTTLYYEAI